LDCFIAVRTEAEALRQWRIQLPMSEVFINIVRLTIAMTPMRVSVRTNL